MTTNKSPEQQMSFLQERISEVGSAIFYNLSESVLRFPTTVVTTHRVDNYGFVWFYVQKPMQILTEFEKEFPVRLEFFRKGVHHRIQVSGSAWIVTDPEELNFSEGGDHIQPEDMILMKVKMSKAEYFETRTQKAKWWHSAVTMFTAWFKSPHYRPATSYFQVS